MPKTLYQTTLNPKKRKLLQVDIPAGSALVTENVITELMGKDTKARYEAIQAWMSIIDNIDV